MNNKRGIYIYTSRICLGLFLLCSFSTYSFASKIALFYDPLYVDINEGNIFAEASNLKASLELLGHETLLYTDFSNIVGADFDLVIIPELEKIGIVENLSSDQFSLYQNYVEDGGSIIIMGVVSGSEFQGDNAINFINKINGSDLSIGGPVLEGTCIKNQNFTGMGFSSVPDEIDNNNAVVYIQPNFSEEINVLYYNKENPSEAAVAELKVGKGSLMYFGWGWWNASPIGSQDGGWLSLLDSAIDVLSCASPQLLLDNAYTFSLTLNGKYSLTQEDFTEEYVACTDVEMTFTPSVFDCDDINKEIQVEVSLMDELERSVNQIISVYIEDLHEVCTLQPLELKLTGSVQTVKNQPLQDVILILEAENPYYLSTNAYGLFNSPILDLGEYQINLDKVATLAKDVTSYDLSLLQRHVLGIERFTSPYQYIAADLNGDKRLDIEDLTIMRKLILNHETGNAIPTNWLWLDKNYSFDTGLRSPLLDDWDNIQGADLDMENLQLQLIGIKVGDIDGSYQDN